MRRLAKRLSGGSLRSRFTFGLETIVAGLTAPAPPPRTTATEA